MPQGGAADKKRQVCGTVLDTKAATAGMVGAARAII